MKRFLLLLSLAASLMLAPVTVSRAAADDSTAAEAAARKKKTEPVIDFTHRYADIHLSMKLSRLKTLNKFLPNSLRREVGDEYYPEIRRQLTAGDSMAFKEGKASIERFDDGKVKLTLTFPNFIMVIREATWEQIDEVFEEYF